MLLLFSLILLKAISNSIIKSTYSILVHFKVFWLILPLLLQILTIIFLSLIDLRSSYRLSFSNITTQINLLSCFNLKRNQGKKNILNSVEK